MTNSRASGDKPLEYGFSATLDNRDHKDAYKTILDQLTEQTLACEQVGYTTVWTGETTSATRGSTSTPIR